MREIKFRYWDKKNKRMESWSEIISEYTNSEHSIEEVLSSKYCMQFTGLKDKNGKEIYEGDIIKGSNEGIAEIEYYPCSFVLYPIDDTLIDKIDEMQDYFNEDSGVNMHTKRCDIFEVIGNIYKNPELLK